MSTVPEEFWSPSVRSVVAEIRDENQPIETNRVEYLQLLKNACEAGKFGRRKSRIVGVAEMFGLAADASVEDICKVVTYRLIVEERLINAMDFLSSVIDKLEVNFQRLKREYRLQRPEEGNEITRIDRNMNGSVELFAAMLNRLYKLVILLESNPSRKTILKELEEYYVTLGYDQQASRQLSPEEKVEVKSQAEQLAEFQRKMKEQQQQKGQVGMSAKLQGILRNMRKIIQDQDTLTYDEYINQINKDCATLQTFSHEKIMSIASALGIPRSIGQEELCELIARIRFTQNRKITILNVYLSVIKSLTSELATLQNSQSDINNRSRLTSTDMFIFDFGVVLVGMLHLANDAIKFMKTNPSRWEYLVKLDEYIQSLDFLLRTGSLLVNQESEARFEGEEEYLLEETESDF